jgi:hypothetical protein
MSGAVYRSGVEDGSPGASCHAAKQEDDDSAEAVASEARRPWRRGVAGHWRGSNFGERREFSCAEVLAGVLFIVFGGEYPNRHFFSRGVMTQGGESMKQTKNSKALRDTFLVIRKGIRIHPSRKALLFQK